MASIIGSGQLVGACIESSDGDSDKETVKAAISLLKEVYEQMGPEPKKES